MLVACTQNLHILVLFHSFYYWHILLWVKFFLIYVNIDFVTMLNFMSLIKVVPRQLLLFKCKVLDWFRALFHSLYYPPTLRVSHSSLGSKGRNLIGTCPRWAISSHSSFYPLLPIWVWPWPSAKAFLYQFNPGNLSSFISLHFYRCSFLSG